MNKERVSPNGDHRATYNPILGRTAELGKQTLRVKAMAEQDGHSPVDAPEVITDSMMSIVEETGMVGFGARRDIGEGAELPGLDYPTGPDSAFTFLPEPPHSPTDGIDPYTGARNPYE